MADTIYDLDTVKPLVLELLMEEPERAYAGRACQYWDVDGDCPDCIIGRVLHRLGIDVPSLVLDNGDQAHSYNTVRFDQVYTVHPYFTKDAQAFLQCVQAKQDAGASWGSVAAEFAYYTTEWEKSSW